MRNPSDQNLAKLVSAPGNKLAYAHSLWANNTKTSIEQFWRTQLSSVSYSPEWEKNVDAIKTYLLKENRRKWLNEVLRYLPQNHLFSSTVYLNLGYDNIVFGENVALNLDLHQFRVDKREAVYYLIHELAHAGYVEYHPLPGLWSFKTNKELLHAVKFLTQLEGMGVISALRLRMQEDGLLDNDYKTLLNDTEKTERVERYFRLFNGLVAKQDERAEENYAGIFEEMSGRKTRLWYITGCYMAQEIEKRWGRETLGKLVKQGSEAFFRTYFELADALRN